VKLRNDWSLADAKERVALPFMDPLFSGRQVYGRFQVPKFVQASAPTSACRLAAAS
jgi:hypothetical protein